MSEIKIDLYCIWVVIDDTGIIQNGTNSDDEDESKRLFTEMSCEILGKDINWETIESRGYSVVNLGTELEGRVVL